MKYLLPVLSSKSLILLCYVNFFSFVLPLWQWWKQFCFISCFLSIIYRSYRLSVRFLLLLLLKKFYLAVFYYSRRSPSKPFPPIFHVREMFCLIVQLVVLFSLGFLLQFCKIQKTENDPTKDFKVSDIREQSIHP